MNIDIINGAMHNGESVTMECKRAKSEVPKSVWVTYSAFANTMEELILLGVVEHRNEKDIAKRFEIIVVDDAQKIINDFMDTDNCDKVSENTLTCRDEDTVEKNNEQIVYIHVPQVGRRVKSKPSC